MEQVAQEQITREKAAYPLFLLGQVIATNGAMGHRRYVFSGALPQSHVRGDWGCVCEEDRETNNEALKAGERILSAYAIDDSVPCEGFGDNTLWIITEADSSMTTFLLPEEY